MTDLLGGSSAVYFSTISESIEHIRAGRLRAPRSRNPQRVRRSARRSYLWANLCRGTRRAAWQGHRRAQNTPTDIIDKLNKDINACIADPKLKARLADLGSTPLVGLSCGFRQVPLPMKTEKWAKVIKLPTVKAE